MTNSRLLKARIVELGLTQKGIADDMGISFTSLSNKILNKYPFKQGEMQSLIDILKIDTDSIRDYFFNEDVD